MLPLPEKDHKDGDTGAREPCEDPVQNVTNGNGVIWKVIAFTSISLVATFFLLALVIHSDRENARKNAEESTRIIAQLIADQTEKNIRSIERQLRSINDAIDILGTSEPFSPLLRKILLSQLNGTPYLMDLLVLDTSGEIIHWTAAGSPPSVKDRDYASFHLDNPGASGLFIGKPRLSRIHENQWFFGISLGITKQGKMDRILVAIVDIKRIYESYRTLNYPDQAHITLAASDGTVYTRIPEAMEAIGIRLKLLERELNTQSVSGNFTTLSPLDSSTRLVAFTKVEGTHLAALASFNMDEVMSSSSHGMAVAIIIYTYYAVFMIWLASSQIKEHRALRRNELLLARMAITDPLTGVYNRRYLAEAGPSEFNRAARYQRNLSCIVLDIDLFKRINDKYGHLAGDHALRQMAGIIRNNCRKIDTPIRSGGEEFILLLPESSEDDAVELAERIRLKVAATVIGFEECSFQLTASFGISSLRKEDKKIDDLIARADAALYQAKENGRDATVIYGMPG